MSDSVPPPQTAAHQAPPSMRFSRQEYWSGVPLLTLHAQLLFQIPALSLKKKKDFSHEPSSSQQIALPFTLHRIKWMDNKLIIPIIKHISKSVDTHTSALLPIMMLALLKQFLCLFPSPMLGIISHSISSQLDPYCLFS